MKYCYIYFSVLIYSLNLLLVPLGRAEEKIPVFEQDIRPVFIKKCGNCHGAKVRKSGLDLSNMNGIHRGGESGESVIDKTAEESLLWILIDGGDMPPEGKPQLTKAERQLIHRWISTGARANNPATHSEKITQHDVIPIVLLRCVTCHGRQLKMGELDLRTPSSMRKGGKSGAAYLPGNADASLIIQRIESEACPPRELLLKHFVKRPPVSEIEVLRKWINTGAAVVDSTPDVATNEPDLLVTDEDRQHWAFKPPVIRSNKDSIDSLILERLQEKGLKFSPQADRDTLIRRAYFDLTGMPPSIVQWKKWRSSTNPHWYSEMIDQLLASPHYGERWGRYWLDVAGYADSEGGVSSDPVRQVAWKYRDYVIEAFNQDKPYNRMLLEQIAGDELLDYDSTSVVTDEMVTNLVATGFLRMGIDQTGSRTMNFVSERLGVIDDALNVLSSGVLGLTMECAKCHSHKYDPIPQRDYYRFKSIFQGALDEHDWLTFKNRSLNIATDEQKKRVSQKNPKLEKQLKKYASQLKKAETALKLEYLRHAYPDQSEADRHSTIRALSVSDNTRTQTQRVLVQKLNHAELTVTDNESQAVSSAKQVVHSLKHQIIKTRQQMEPPLTVRALWDRGEPSPTYILLRGEHDQPGRLVGPGVPSVLTDGKSPFKIVPPFPQGTSKTGRRLALARWLTQPNHPLTTRVIVNRIWYHHFGTGLVKSLENFGVKGEPPSHPKLLDWLAVKFVQQGWSIKTMHRLIMNSRAYQQSNRITTRNQQLDPQNRLLAHFPLRRMDAEALRDALLFVSGKLNITPGGPPDTVTVNRDGLVSVNPVAGGRWRRSIYLQYRRTEIPTLMETFDYPEMGPNCVSRSESTVSPQSLMLLNNNRIRGYAQAMAERVEKLQINPSDDELGARVDTVYQLALSRYPQMKERHLGKRTLEKLRISFKGDMKSALTVFCHTIFNSAAFLYID